MSDEEVIVRVEKEVLAEEGSMQERPQEVRKQSSIEEAEIEEIMEDLEAPTETYKEVVQHTQSEVVPVEQVREKPAVCIERESQRALVWASSEKYDSICDPNRLQRFRVGDLERTSNGYFINVFDETSGTEENVPISGTLIESLSQGRRAEEFSLILSTANEAYKEFLIEQEAAPEFDESISDNRIAKLMIDIGEVVNDTFEGVVDFVRNICADKPVPATYSNKMIDVKSSRNKQQVLATAVGIAALATGMYSDLNKMSKEERKYSISSLNYPEEERKYDYNLSLEERLKEKIYTTNSRRKEYFGVRYDNDLESINKEEFYSKKEFL